MAKKRKKKGKKYWQKFNVPGVNYDKQKKRWIATGALNGKRMYLGSFVRKSEAVRQRVAIEAMRGGDSIESPGWIYLRNCKE